MIIIMKANTAEDNITAVIGRVETLGYGVHLSQGAERTIVGIIGNGRPIEKDQIARMTGVERVMVVSKPYKLASREFHPEDTRFEIGSRVVGRDLLIIAGPSVVESRRQIIEIAQAVKEAGAHALRGGAFKPRSSPYAFQGLGEQALEYLAEARDLTGLPIVTEVASPEMVPVVAQYADVLQIGARNMQNHALLNAVGKAHHPVLLKRSMHATIQEWLMSAEFILSHGNRRVVLCERGIRTYESETKNTFDVNAIPVIKRLSHLPVMGDPSHGTGEWRYVAAVARAAVAAGADGVLVEVHPNPEEALSDGAQSLKPERFAKLVEEMTAIAALR